MENAFLDCRAELGLLGREYYSQNNLTFLVIALKRWEKTLVKTDPILMTQFKNKYYDSLKTMYETLNAIKDTKITSLFNKIFTHRLAFSKHMPSNVSNIFGAFIKGITFFSNELPIGSPAYHRLVSCGLGRDAYHREFMKCKADMIQTERKATEQRIHTCYIERLIYDRLYRDLTLHFPLSGDEVLTQDKRHLDFLEDTKRDFQSCFPNTDYTVSIEYENNKPYMLTIQKLYQDKEVVLETYLKEFDNSALGGLQYGPIVFCTKKTKDKHYVRYQRFDQSSFVPWRRVSKNERSRPSAEGA